VNGLAMGTTGECRCECPVGYAGPHCEEVLPCEVAANGL